MRYFRRLWLLLCLTGCTFSSSKDYTCIAEGICKSLCVELKKIESNEDFTKVSPKLEKYFNDLVGVMINLREFQEKYPDEEAGYSTTEPWYSVEMQMELERIYSTIEGGRSLIEKTQKEALLKLDAYEKNRKKQKNYLPRKG